MSCMNLWIWSMLAIGKFHRVKAGKAVPGYKDGRWKVSHGFFLKDRSSRSKPTGCRSVCFFYGFLSIASIIECHFLCLFLGLPWHPGICQSQTSRQRQWWWLGEMDSDTGKMVSTITSTSGVFPWPQKRGGLFHGSPQKDHRKNSSFVKWEAVNFLWKVWRDVSSRVSGVNPFLWKEMKGSFTAVIFPSLFSPQILFEECFSTSFGGSWPPRILRIYFHLQPFLSISNISVDWFFWGRRHAIQAKKNISCETSRNGWCQALYKRSFRRETQQARCLWGNRSEAWNWCNLFGRRCNVVRMGFMWLQQWFMHFF